MNQPDNGERILAPYRVLDLTDEKGFLCGRMLGDLGADVVKIEPPGGDPARRLGPFYHEYPHPEKSLTWFAYNANKRGVTLDITSADGQEIFRRLVEKADFVIESFQPGYLDGFGLGYSGLKRLNPKVILVSITPFGQTGPYRDYKGPDLVAMALGGLMGLCGEPDRPPVRVSSPQTHASGGAQGALGAMVAHYHRVATGEGQHVDVSSQESMVPSLYNALLFWQFKKVNIKRSGPYRSGQGSLTVQRLHFPCKDGFVGYTMFGGAAGAETNRRLTEWMDSEGMAPQHMKDRDWTTWDFFTLTQEELDSYEKPMMAFFQRHTKRELYDGARERRIMLYPISTTADIAADPQLAARDFWERLEHPELGDTLTYAGSFAKFSAAECRLWRRAPLIGEHNEEIYHGELGISKEHLVVLKQAGVI